MTNSTGDGRSLEAVKQRIAEVEVSIVAFQRLLDQGTFPATDAVHLARAETLLKELYAQQQVILERWHAEPNSSL